MRVTVLKLISTTLLAVTLAACASSAAQPIPLAALPPTATREATSTAAPAPSATIAPTATSAPPTAIPTPHWTTFHAPIGFSVELPGVPSDQTSLGESLLGPITTYTATLTLDDQHRYTVFAASYPGRPIIRDDPGGVHLLEDLRDQMLKGVNAHTIHERPVFLTSFAGRELAIDAEDGSSVRARFYIADTTLFRLTARVPTSEADSDALTSDINRFFASFALTPPSASPTPPWQIFRLDGAKCTIALPVQPTTSQHTEPSLVGAIDTTEYTATQDDRGVRFSVSERVYPERVFSKDDPNGIHAIDQQRDLLAKAVGGQLIDEQPISLGAAHGREVLMDLADGGYVRARWYVVGNRLYQVTLQTRTAISSPAEAAPLVPNYDEVGRFFLSFGPDM